MQWCDDTHTDPVRSYSAALIPERIKLTSSYFWCLRLPAIATFSPFSSLGMMAPLGDADHCRDKARRDLLALLEGVSTNAMS